MESIKALEVGCGADRYAIDLRLVREVIYSPSILKLPNPSYSVTGISVWREEEVPVHDLRLALGLPDQLPAGEMVMMMIASKPTGLLVERSGNIKLLDGSDVIAVGDELTGGRGYVKSGYKQAEGIIYLLEIEEMLGLSSSRT